MITFSRAGSFCNCLLALSLIGLSPSLRAEDEVELLEFVKAAHQSAQENVHSLSCTVRLEAGFPSLEFRKEGKYWRSFDRARIQQMGLPGTADYYFLGKDSEVRCVIRNSLGGGKTSWHATRQPLTQAANPIDVWREMLLGFDRFSSRAKSPLRAKREKINGRDYVRVTMTCDMGGDEWFVTYWFDVGHNYLAWKRTTEFKDGRDEVEIVEFIEPQPAVFFPTKRIAKGFEGFQQSGQSLYTLSDVRINEPIPDSVLELPRVPNGTMCNDLIRKQRYPINETWQQIPGSKAKPFEIEKITGSPGQTQFTAQSTEEPWSWTYWIAPMALAVLALAGAIWVYRRYHARSLETGVAGS